MATDHFFLYTNKRTSTPGLFASPTSFLSLSLSLPHPPLLNTLHARPIPPTHLLLTIFCPLPTT